MGYSILILAVICVFAFALFLYVYLGEQKDEEDYQCYMNKFHKYEAGNFMCKGEENNKRCGHCPYYRKWKRRNVYK